MRHPGLIDFFTKTDSFKEIINNTQKYGTVSIYGIDQAQKHFVMTALGNFVSLPLLIIASCEDKARALIQDFSVYFPRERVEYFPVREIVPVETYAQSREIQSQRVQVLDKVLRDQVPVVVSTPDALCRRLSLPESFKSLYIHIKTGQDLQREHLVEKLVRIGYERVEVVEIPGQFAVRGGIVDVFGITGHSPLRIDYFGDEIDTLRFFDPLSQRSREKADNVTLLPAVEFSLLPGEQGWEAGKAILEQDWEAALKTLEGRKTQTPRDNLKDKYSWVVADSDLSLGAHQLEQYLPYFVKPKVTLLDYYANSPLIIFDEPHRINDAVATKEKDTKDIFQNLLDEGSALPRQRDIVVDYSFLREKAENSKKVLFSLLPVGPKEGFSPRSVSVSGRDLPLFQGRFPMLVAQIRDWQRQKYTVVLMTSTEDRGRRLKEGLWDSGVEAVVVPEVTSVPAQGQVIITYGKPVAGFEFPAENMALVSDNEIFGRTKLRKPPKQYDQGLRITDYSDIKAGDYVVHVQHGIGKYLGVINMDIQGTCKDYLHIKYAGKDKLYVPTDNVDLINKYVGAEGQKPKLHKLGGTEWARTKGKVKESVTELAQELLRLYAARETVPGFAFSSDTAWQAEFEEAFPFTETQDQLTAVAEIKADMEKTKPMDRLLVGDVGYGKTEVALRGAFKAIMDNKQVAVLVPTTVLAQQHLRTFTDRFTGVPAKIEALSRLKTAAEQKKIVEAVKQGKIDILIGTHRLLSKDVCFKDLGLLIIDEEQRFGVSHKEKLKQLRQNVDVLTLTATPIPRTLHMALAGARDLSVINTPPENRYPVQTYVVEFSQELVTEAIRRELDRGGQVFYVHNIVSGLDRTASRLQKLLPQARIAVGHGQMPERQLDKVMVDFVEGAIDVLVCTTIVENGLDISNVNTLIVENADRFGLSQLYQLRGRVGRSNRIAYAYFTYDKRKSLGELAEKRLNAIREFTEFGSGFKLAMRDLEIRGAGNLLGAEQHGHMLTVGFDLYCSLLEGAVQALKGAPEQAEDKPAQVEIELNFSAYVADSYIRESGLKLDVYHRLRDIANEAELQEFSLELQDRFGKLPKEVENLFLIVNIRLLAQAVGIKAVRETAKEVKLAFHSSTPVKGDMLMVLARDFPRQLAFSSVEGLEIKVSKQRLTGESLVQRVIEILARIYSLAGIQG